MDRNDGWDRRSFLSAVTAGAPSLTLMAEAAGHAAVDPEKFTPVDLSAHFSASAAEFGPRSQARGFPGGDSLIRMPAGRQQFRGIPFSLGPNEVKTKSWVVLSTKPDSWTTPRMEVAVGRTATYLCLAQFCDWDENEARPNGVDDIEQAGQLLAEAAVIYEDGAEVKLPIRRRFEVNAPSFRWGHWSFTSLAHPQLSPVGAADPLSSARNWGTHQTGIRDSWGEPNLWICALENPHPAKRVRALRIQAASQALLAVCGLTLFHGRENPLCYQPLRLYRISLPEAVAPGENRWTASVDLGVVARTYVLPSFEPQSWLAADEAGYGEIHSSEPSRNLYVEVSANSGATLSLQDAKTGRRYTFGLANAGPNRELEATPAGSRIEFLEPVKTWIHGRVVDTATGRPTPARLAFRSREGRYIPPYGHRREVNDGWFQDYGADLKLESSSFAYVDGTFQVELPVGEVYVEVTKGFEYEPVRKKLAIQPGQRELTLDLSREIDFRSRGWVTADTHVHFLSTSTAVLEGQAEGLNFINLLAAQWGDLYTNVGDLSHEPLTSRDGETVVWVGTENRSHVLGHIGLLGGKGEPVYPLSGSFPSASDEAYFGDPLWMTMADWADACRKRDGLSVAVHFPYPTAELAADIVLGKIDAVEAYAWGNRFNSLPFLDWYRCLNCGYRLPVVGGTDKMSAGTAVGEARTYAYLGNDEFSFANWAKAVRGGNTFTTTGPLLSFVVDGRSPGQEITIGANGAALEVAAEARSFAPLTRLEIVFNGKVLFAKEEKAGARRLALKETLRVPGPGWLAARCSARLDPKERRGTAAHTSPVYLQAPGQEVFSGPAAAYLLTLIEGTQAWVNNMATRPDPERFERVRAVLKEAHEKLSRRIHTHG